MMEDTYTREAVQQMAFALRGTKVRYGTHTERVETVDYREEERHDGSLYAVLTIHTKAAIGEMAYRLAEEK